MKDTIIPKHLRHNNFNYIFTMDSDRLKRLQVICGGNEAFSVRSHVSLYANNYTNTLVVSSNYELDGAPIFSNRITEELEDVFRVIDSTICLQPIKFNIETDFVCGRYYIKRIDGPSHGDVDIKNLTSAKIIKKAFYVEDGSLIIRDLSNGNRNCILTVGEKYSEVLYRTVVLEISKFIDERIRAAAAISKSVGRVTEEIY